MLGAWRTAETCAAERHTHPAIANETGGPRAAGEHVVIVVTVAQGDCDNRQMPEHRMWPASESRTGSTGVYGNGQRADGPDPATMRRDWPRYDDWHREAIAANAAMPPLEPTDTWLPDS